MAEIEISIHFSTRYVIHQIALIPLLLKGHAEWCSSPTLLKTETEWLVVVVVGRFWGWWFGVEAWGDAGGGVFRRRQSCRNSESHPSHLTVVVKGHPGS